MAPSSVGARSQLEPPGLDARDVEQRVDQAAEAPRLALGGLERVLQETGRRVLAERERALHRQLQRRHRRAQLVRSDREELVALRNRLLGAVIEALIVDGEGGALGQIRRQRQIVVIVAALRVAGGEHHGADDLPPRAQRDRHARAHAEPVQDRQLVLGGDADHGALERPRQLRGGDVVVDDRFARVDHSRDRAIAPQIGLQLAQELDLRRVVMVGRGAANLPVLVDEQEVAPVAQPRHRHARDDVERRHILERAGQDLRRRGEEGRAPRGAPLGGDVAEAPDAPDAAPLDELRARVALEDAAVAQLDDVVADGLGLGVERAHLGEESVRIAQLPAGDFERARVVAVGEHIGRHVPHLREVAVEVDHAPRAVDDEDAVGGRLERGAQERRRLRRGLLGAAALGQVDADAGGAGDAAGIVEQRRDVRFPPGLAVAPLEQRLFAGERATR